MKYVVFSDLHGNSYALKKMLKNTENEVDGYIFLGDVCGYYTHQQECIELLQAIPTLILVRGNHDDYYLRTLKNNRKKNDLINKYGQSYNNKLSSSCILFLEMLPLCCELRIDGLNIFCAHGGLEDYLEERIYPDQFEAHIHKKIVKYDMILTGHTHYPMIKKLPNGGMWINPGSLGQPRDGGWFSYFVIDFSERECRQHYVKLDKKILAVEIDNVEKGSDVGRYLKKTLAKMGGKQ